MKYQGKVLKKVYIIGIKGVAMTALAEILSTNKIKVLGSDTSEKFYTDKILQKFKIQYFEQFSKTNLPKDINLIIHSTAYNKDNNVELSFAIKKKLPIVSYPNFLAYLFNQKKGIAICGSHGKTTTSALTAFLLQQSKKDPMALVGSKVLNWQKSSLAGQGELFVVEADEYQDKFLKLKPFGVILTNVDFDHPDFFPDAKAYKNSFLKFAKKIPKKGIFVYNLLDKDSQAIARLIQCRKISYGKNPKADFYLKQRKVNQKGEQIVKFIDNLNNKKYSFTLGLGGEHNALNALASIAMCSCFDLTMEQILKNLPKFQSTERRFQKKGIYQGCILYDDYAHHPSEIKATILGAKELYPKKQIIVGFHPHTFTRTAKFKQEFSDALDLADQVFLIDIYASAREKIGKIKISSDDLANLINKNKLKKAYNVNNIPNLAQAIKKQATQDKIFISMGAGDIWKVHDLL